MLYQPTSAYRVRQAEMCLLCSAYFPLPPYAPPTDTTCVCPGPSEKARQQRQIQYEKGEQRDPSCRDQLRRHVKCGCSPSPAWLEVSRQRKEDSGYICLFVCFYLTVYVCSPQSESELHWFLCLDEFIIHLPVFACQTVCLYYLLISFVPYLNILLCHIISVECYKMHMCKPLTRNEFKMVLCCEQYGVCNS